jgi:hypothetical protein
VDLVIQCIPQVFSVEKNTTQTRDFTARKVDQALKQMAPLKAPSHNGMPLLFYQTFWHVVGNEVIEVVLNFLNGGTLPNSLNHTHITLIPKIKSPERIIDYHPISLCNVIYKIFFKVFVNQLKKVLPHIISFSQSPFVSGRLITDNVLVAFETLHYMKTKGMGKTWFMTMKLDMSKAYDRGEWAYMWEVTKKMGFRSCPRNKILTVKLIFPFKVK